MIIEGYFSYFSSKPYIVTPHLNRLDGTVQMRVENICFMQSKTRAVTRQHSSPEPVLAHHEHKVLNSKSIRKVMLLPYNNLKQSEYNLPFRHINKSMTLTSVFKWNWGGIV